MSNNSDRQRKRRKANKKSNMIFAIVIIVGLLVIGLLVAQVLKKPEEKKPEPVKKAEDLEIKWDKVDTSELKSLIKGIESIDESLYTKTSVKKLNKVLEESKQVIAKKNVGQEEIRETYVKLARALEKLKTKNNQKSNKK